jgi:hypothetical protein
MNLVFGAEGLSVGEGAFLMACCNHTDDRGYVIASMQQLADESHMKITAAKSNKQRLIGRGLLKSAERFHPKNGARIADLYRVNVDMLRGIQRERVDYGPTLVEELTFDAVQEKPSSDPRSDSDGGRGRIPTEGGQIPTGGGSESDGDAGSESDPLLLPSLSPSPLSSVRPASGAPQGPREERETNNNTQPESALSASQTPGRAVDGAVSAETSHGAVQLPLGGETALKIASVTSDPEAEATAVFVRSLPGRLGAKSVAALAPLVAAAFHAGWPAGELHSYLRSRVDVKRVYSPMSVYRKHLEDLPERAVPGQRPGAPAAAMCPRHPAFADGDCPGCHREEQQRLRRDVSESRTDDGAGLLARLRAGQPAS